MGAGFGFHHETGRNRRIRIFYKPPKTDRLAFVEQSPFEESDLAMLSKQIQACHIVVKSSHDTTAATTGPV